MNAGETGACPLLFKRGHVNEGLALWSVGYVTDATGVRGEEIPPQGDDRIQRLPTRTDTNSGSENALRNVTWALPLR